MKQESFNKKLATECIQAFSFSTGIGTTLSTALGEPLSECGYGCESCELCTVLGLPKQICAETQQYGVGEAKRFGGQYIYFCPVGLTHFVLPILTLEGIAAKITAGPFLMVEQEDFVECDILEKYSLSPAELQNVFGILEKIPTLAPSSITYFSKLLFMASGFIGNISKENQLLETEYSAQIQGQISAYILENKHISSFQGYSVALEQLFLESFSKKDMVQSKSLLNKLLAQMVSVKLDMQTRKHRTCELLSFLSRIAIEQGSNVEASLSLCERYHTKLFCADSFDTLCLLFHQVFDLYAKEWQNTATAKHYTLLNTCKQYILDHYNKPIALEQIAHTVHLNPAYLSKIFKQENGCSINEYINEIRINRAKELLQNQTLRLTDIALLVGFEDQSYFTKVFKKFTGTAPNTYRQKLRGSLQFGDESYQTSK